ncbi:mismatch repair endonuclease PMS2-like [Macrosteles quadrilineatus]|uniref:mismatch repair endonuclease PMS2-like n=1 Tax=Macrosteles quadrilineatus TaxID=74068 RepID=UPI0023E2BCEB|nr:mismatch repair endonuclease PMS2-like [Macrosteles quadrilineatus]
MNTSKNIKAIDKEAVHRICSGQVVLNLAVAVKELVENSLDAGATVIDVRLKEYGSELIEVTDNGSGVEPDNFQGLTLKHHTSKLQDFSDLVSVETFGFRGEALSSLCSLSDLTVTTRHTSSDCGSRLQYDHNGLITLCTSVARQVGTTVTLENIFSTLPVRHKEFLRHLKREFVKMTQLLYAYCLVSTGVKITCTNHTKKGGKMTVVATQGCKTVRENIACVFGTKQLSSLLELKTVTPTEEILEQHNLKYLDMKVEDVFQLEGLVSSCAHGLGRSTNDRQFYYVNSRPCEPTKVVKAVNEVFHQYNLHQQPFVFLNVSSARDSVDVNVTPDKRQVFLEHEKLLLATVKASLQVLYENIPSTYTVNNIQTSVRKQVSPQKISSPVNSPASVLSQFRHASAGKRQSIDPPNPKQAKQVKLDSIFAKQTPTIESFAKTSLDIVDQSIESSQNSASCMGKSSVINVEDNTICEISERTSTLIRENTLVDSCEEVSNCETSCKIEVLSKSFESRTNSQSSNLSQISDPGSNVEETCMDKSNVPDIESGVSSQSSSELTTSSVTVESISKSPDAGIDNDVIFSSLENVCDERTDSKSVIVEFDSQIGSGDHRRSVEVDVSIGKISEYFRQACATENAAEEKQVRFRAVIDPSKNKQAEQELSREISKGMFAKMDVIGQFNLGFIIARLGSDLFIVDQHATDEKYNFETLQRTEIILNQKLVVPQKLELTAVNEAVLIDNIDVFKRNGFEFIIDENAQTTSKVKLASVPMSRNWTFGKEDVDELLFMLQDAPGTLCRPSRVRAMFASRACRKSVMIGSALSHAEMKRLLVHMGEIEQPWNCPHGRPTMRHLINLDFV